MLKLKFAFLLTLFSALTSAQIKIHKSLTTEDGLIQGEVNAIFQDSKDFIWIGTLGGISIWDGMNFKNLNVYNGLPASQIMDIKESPKGVIYLATYGGGVLKITDEKFDTINVEDGLLDNIVTRILILTENKILFFSNGGKISKLENGKFSDFSNEINFPKSDIWDAHVSEKGIIYCATSSGLVTIKNNFCEIINSQNGLSSNLLWSVNSIGDSIIYVGTNLAAHKIINGNIQTLKSNIATYKIHISKNNVIYFATNDGILIDKNGTLQEIKSENGLISNDNWTLAEDKNGFLYFGTNGNGVSIFNPKEYLVNYNYNFGFTDDKILSITTDMFDNKILGTKTGLIKFHDSKNFSFIKADNERGSLINALYKKQNGNILVGTYHGLKILKNNSLINYVDDPQIANNEIYTIAEIGNKILVGTFNGVYSIENNQVTKISYFDNIESNFIISILPIDENQIYFGSFNKGIFHLNKNKFSTIRKENGLSDNTVNSLYKRKDGTLLVGTQNGLNILKNDIVVDIINMRDGLSNNAIVAIVEDSKGRIFASTNKGLNIIYNIDLKSRFIKSITHKDGLIYDNCLKGSMFVDKSGNILVGTSRGLSIYNPEKDDENIYPPKIYLTKLEIFGKDYPISELSINNGLNFNQNYLKFIYTAISLTAPEKTIFKYRLSSIDKNWVTSNVDNVQYTNLDDGKYTFEVKARNEWGYWSEPARLAFVINPAWWETWWFYTLVTLGIGSLIAFIASYRYRNLLAVEKIRTKISADLHDSIGSGLSEITILSELFNIQAKPNLEDLQSGMKNISVTARSLVGNMSDIVWLVNPSKDSLKDLLLRLQDSYHEVFAQANISFKIDGIENLEVIHLPLTYRQHLFLLFKEAINNSLKYSNCSEMILEILAKNKILTITFNDNGKGFDLAKKNNGNGLLNMKERAKNIGGEVEITSKINKGTTIKFIGKIKT